MYSMQAHAAAQPSPSKISLEMLRRPLPLPSSLRDKGLTRSQLLFSVGTTIDPRALRNTADDEFYLFMDMRAEFKWTSFGMTASKWATATKTYNDRLEDLMKKKNAEFIRKNPRALADKLSEIEPKITDRILKGNYKCTSLLFYNFYSNSRFNNTLVSQPTHLEQKRSGESTALQYQRLSGPSRRRTAMVPAVIFIK